MKTLLFLVILSCAVLSVSAQTRSGIMAPTVVDENAERISDPTLKELTDLLGDPDLDCKKETYTVAGTIGKLYLDNGGRTLSAFVILDAKNKRHPMNLNNDPLGAVGKYSFETVKAVFTGKRKIEATYVKCRDSAIGILNYVTQVKVD